MALVVVAASHHAVLESVVVVNIVPVGTSGEGVLDVIFLVARVE